MISRGVHANADVSRYIERGDASRRWRERFWILSVDAALDGMALDGHRLLNDLGQILARGDQDLAPH